MKPSTPPHFHVGTFAALVLLYVSLLVALCCFTGCAQVARGQQVCGPNGFCPPRLIRIAPQGGMPQRYPADAANTRPTLASGVSSEAGTDHSVFVRRDELKKWTDSVKANFELHTETINGTRELAQAAEQKATDLKDATDQTQAGLAGKIVDVEKQLGDKIENIKIEIPKLLDSSAGQAAKQAAGQVAGELVAQAAGPQALPLLKVAALFGGPPAVVAAIGAWFVLRTVKRRLPAIQTVEARLQSFGGAGGAAPNPFRDDPASRRAHPTGRTDGNG